MDSPRGRIYLINLAEKGEIGLEGPLHEHIDRCLGCMACVTACPSGVQYDKLLEAVRPQLERNVRRAAADRLFREAIFALFPYKRRLRAAAVPGALYQRLRALPAVRRSPRSCRASSARWSRCCRRSRCARRSPACPSASPRPASGGPPSRC